MHRQKTPSRAKLKSNTEQPLPCLRKVHRINCGVVAYQRAQLGLGSQLLADGGACASWQLALGARHCLATAKDRYGGWRHDRRLLWRGGFGRPGICHAKSHAELGSARCSRGFGGISDACSRGSRGGACTACTSICSSGSQAAPSCPPVTVFPGPSCSWQGSMAANATEAVLMSAGMWAWADGSAVGVVGGSARRQQQLCMAAAENAQAGDQTA